MSEEAQITEVAPSPGQVTLPEDAAKLNRWLFDTISPYISGRILEMGSSMGAIAAHFIEKSIPLHLSDEDPEICNKLIDQYTTIETIKAVHKVDFHRANFSERYATKLNKFETLVAINYSEHQLYDNLALQNAKLLLRPKGILTIIIQVHTGFYYGLDGNSDIIKQYNWKELTAFIGQEFEILKTRYFTVDENETANKAGLFALVIARKLE